MSRHFNHQPLPKEKLSFKKTWGKLLAYCKKYVPVISVALLFAVGGTIFTLISPDKLGEMTSVIEKAIPNIALNMPAGELDFNLLGKIALTLGLFYSLSVILSYFQSFIMSTVTQKISKRMRNDISKKINKLPLKYFDKTKSGDILSRVTNDVDTISHTLNQSIAGLVSAVVLFVGSIIMMFLTNAVMALVAIGSSLIGFLFMSFIVSKSRKYYVSHQKYLGEINGHIEESYSGHNVIKAYNADERFNQEFSKINQKLYNTSWKSHFLSGLMMPLMNFVGNLGFVAVCVVGAVLTINGQIDFKVIIEFMIYVNLFTQPLSTFAQSISSLQQTGAASFRVFEFLDQEELDDESHITEKLVGAKGKLEFKNVKFGYDENKTIISDFSALVKPGQKVAVVGPTGAGKTTLVNLLMRFYETNSGDILIDDVSIKSLTRKNVHDLFCMVLQDTWLFEGTIRENIVYNNTDVSEEKIVQACKTVGLHHFIQTLPQGYDTPLNEEANLSSGQKQLLTIARAMINDSPMLILDEATSSVDTRSEILIQEAMDKLTENKTSIIIAHRLSTIKNADLILVMKDGDIIESGNHEQLLSLDGFYADLYNSQFEKVSCGWFYSFCILL